MLVLNMYLSNTLFARSPLHVYLYDLILTLLWIFPLGIVGWILFYFLHGKTRAEFYFIVTVGLQVGLGAVAKILSSWALERGFYSPGAEVLFRTVGLLALIVGGVIVSKRFYYPPLATFVRKFVIGFFLFYLVLAGVDGRLPPSYPGNTSQVSTGSYPNIYFIIADAYPWPNAVEKYWHRHVPLVTELEKRGFLIQKKACTPFFTTHAAMPCYWAMTNEPLDTLPRFFESLHHLDSLGYEIRYFVPSYTPARLVAGEREYFPYLSELGERFMNNYLFPLNLVSKYLVTKIYVWRVSKNLFVQGNNPTFTYIHLPVPHLPYQIDSTGGVFLSTLGSLSQYRQLRYTDGVILRWVDSILVREKKNTYYSYPFGSWA
ncbi:MAG: hypothetical protein ACUVRD_06695 [Bacteroidia bacterium]